MISDAMTLAKHVTLTTSASASSLPESVETAQTALENQHGMQPIYYAGAAIAGIGLGIAAYKYLRRSSPHVPKKTKHQY